MATTIKRHYFVIEADALFTTEVQPDSSMYPYADWKDDYDRGARQRAEMILSFRGVNVVTVSEKWGKNGPLTPVYTLAKADADYVEVA